MTLSVSPTSLAKSSLEEMLASLRQRDESKKPRDLPPALPSRPPSRGRLPSARRSLPTGFKIDANVLNTEENGKEEEEEGKEDKELVLVLKKNSFGRKSMRKEKDVDSPYSAKVTEGKRSDEEMEVDSDVSEGNLQKIQVKEENRLPSAPQSLPTGFKIGANVLNSDKNGKEEEERKEDKELVLVLKNNDFGSKRMRKEQDVALPYPAKMTEGKRSEEKIEVDSRVSGGNLQQIQMKEVKKVEWNGGDNIGYFIKKVAGKWRIRSLKCWFCWRSRHVPITA